MISTRLEKVCCEDLSLIENYDKAINDNTQTWDLHHRLETDNQLTRQDLIDANLYYHRPASELIFLTKKEHGNIHRKTKKIHVNNGINELYIFKSELDNYIKIGYKKGRKKKEYNYFKPKTGLQLVYDYI